MTATNVLQELNRFEQLSRDRGAVNVERMRPGIDPERIRSLELEYGVRLPDDAKAVWLWHDGVADQDETLTVRFWGPAHYFLDLESSLRDARAQLISRNAGDVFRRPGSSWLTLGHHTVSAVIDITEPHAADSPVLVSDATAAIEEYPVMTLSERIRMWNSAIDDHVWYLGNDRQWNRHLDRALADRARKGRMYLEAASYRSDIGAESTRPEWLRCPARFSVMMNTTTRTTPTRMRTMLPRLAIPERESAAG